MGPPPPPPPIESQKGLKECVLKLGIVKLSLRSIIEKVFKYGETELLVIKCKDDIWFRGKTLAEVLSYSNPLNAKALGFFLLVQHWEVFSTSS